MPKHTKKVKKGVFLTALATVVSIVLERSVEATWPNLAPGIWWAVTALLIVLMLLLVFLEETRLLVHCIGRKLEEHLSRRSLSRLAFGFLVAAILATIFFYDDGREKEPSGSTTLPQCDLSELLESIEWAVEEHNVQHFEQDIRGLYPRLEQCGLKMPLIDPARSGLRQYDVTWHGFHVTFLKALHRFVRNDEFDLDQWNTDVVRENAKRTLALEDFAQSLGSESH